MITINKRIIQSLMILLSFTFCSTFADVIKNYHVDITILEDGKIDVIETIVMDIDHQDIRLGIIRDIPSYYYLFQNKIETPVQVLSVTRNGQPEHYWIEKRSEVYEVFTGARQDIRENYISRGINTYVIHWQSENHIRGFMDYDELYFNAIGTSWQFPIEKASATVYLPDSVKAFQSAGYYGKNGARTKADVIEKSSQEVEFIASKSIGNRQGLTISTGFTQGIIPTAQVGFLDRVVQKSLSYLPPIFQPVHVVWLLISTVMLVYWIYGACVYAIRKSRSERTFMVRLSPPKIALDKVMALESKSYAVYEGQFQLALLVDLAQRKIISFNNDDEEIAINISEGRYISDELTRGQKKFIQVLDNQLGGKTSYTSYNPILAKALKSLVEPTIKYGQSIYHSVVPCFYTIAFILFAASVALSTEVLPSEALMLILPFFGTMVLRLGILSFFSAFLSRHKLRDLGVSLMVLIFGLVFSMISTLYFGHTEFDVKMSLYSGLVLVGIFLLFWSVIALYGKISVCVKPEYLDDQQQVLEFKHFLQHTKEAEYQVIAPDLFEEYLPYAIGFGVDDNWLNLYQRLYPTQYEISRELGGVAICSIGKSNTFSAATKAPSSSRGGGSSGSGGGGSSGSGSGGGGGRGR